MQADPPVGGLRKMPQVIYANHSANAKRSYSQFDQISLFLRKGLQMDIQALKIELVKQILESESKELLDQIYSTLKREEKDFWIELTDDQKEEVEIGRRQVSNGETEDWETLRERLLKKSS